MQSFTDNDKGRLAGDEATELKIQEALLFLEKDQPEERKLVEGIIKYIIMTGSVPFPGNVVVHDFPPESVIGEYYLSLDMKDISVEDLADRLVIVAYLIKNKRGKRPGESWIFSGAQVEDLITGRGRLCIH